jgi:hypothetical protein
VFHIHNLLRCIKNQASIDTIARCVSLHNCVAAPLRHLSRIDGSHRLCDAITAQIRNAAAATLPALQETGLGLQKQPTTGLFFCGTELICCLFLKAVETWEGCL